MLITKQLVKGESLLVLLKRQSPKSSFKVLQIAVKLLLTFK